MNAIVKSVLPKSPASGTIIRPGDAIRKINGNIIGDILDYKFHSYEQRLLLEFLSPDGKLKLIRIRKPEGTDIGLEFETFLMDKERSCANRCIFCFIDQLPPNMRETLYYKDDDLRLSFLQGNYITLTNLQKRDIGRIVRLRISPINVSVHTLDPELRSFMLGNKNAAAGIDALKTLTGAGITLNCQIVCCPGMNDGEELVRTMEGLYALGQCVNSVSIVPVGLTKHRGGLVPLQPFDRGLARKTVGMVEDFSDMCLKKRGSRVFFCADELYIKAGLDLLPYESYEDFPQLENGVGMMRLLISEFEEELGNLPPVSDSAPFSIATGADAREYLTNLLNIAAERYGIMDGTVYAVRNDFFGNGVTVAGLITGGDIIRQLAGKNLGYRLLIPRNMLRSGENVFLDDVTVAELSAELKVPVRVVEQDGADFLHAILGG